MSVIEALLTGMAANGLYALDADTAVSVVAYLRENEPTRIAALEATAAAGDDQRLREEIAGALRMVRMSGAVAVDDGVIDAVRLAMFDHAAGTINIEGVSIPAPTLARRDAAPTTAVAGTDKFRSLQADEDIRRGVSGADTDAQSNL